MRNALVTVAAIGVVGMVWLLPARGQVQSAPGPGSGVVTVTGRVEIADGQIRASQLGDWRVTLANAADVRVVNTPTVVRAAHPFLKTGARVQVTWPDGSTETVAVVQLGGAGWVQGESGARTRWINLDTARYLEVAK